MHTLTTALAQINTEARALFGQGKVADYIPALARIDPNKLGFALALPDGTVHTAGDADEAFSIQSVSKVFTLASKPKSVRAASQRLLKEMAPWCIA